MEKGLKVNDNVITMWGDSGTILEADPSRMYLIKLFDDNGRSTGEVDWYLDIELTPVK